MNQIQTENALAGTTSWKLTNPVVMTDRDGELRTRAIEGYCSATSVNLGGQIKFHVSTTDSSFSVHIYRMGYYGGDGGRLMATHLNLPGSNQATPTRGTGGVMDCNWTSQLTLTIPNDGSWVSGIYLGKLTAGSSGKQSYVIFVVRDDARTSSILFQSAITTAQAYNGWGQCSYYAYSDTRNKPGGTRAYRVSFNRPYYLAHYGEIEPYPTVETAPMAAGSGHLFAHYPWVDPNRVQDCWVPAWEYNMVRWLEKNGYDVTYCTNLDVHEQPALLLSHKQLLSIGHDEYWSRDMRLHVEYARDQGIDLTFLSANRVYRQVRFEADAQGVANRIMANWGDSESGDTLYASITNGTASASDTYPYPNLSAEIRSTAWPETLLLGTTWATPNSTAVFHEDLIVADSSHWIFTGANPMVETGQVLSDVVGYEMDSLRSSDPLPPNLQTIAESEHGGQAVMYIADSGATVFVGGTVQWSWGLDDFVIDGPTSTPLRSAASNAVVQQMTKNLLARAELTNAGSGRFYSTDGRGKVSAIAAAIPGWRSKWQIIPGTFTNSAYTSFLFYDPTRGEAFIFNYNGSGGLTMVGNGISGWRKTWQIVPGKFSSSSTYTDLLLHDKMTGEIYFASSLGNGSISVIGKAAVTFPGAYKLYAGKFYSGNTGIHDLLVYNPLRGEVWLWRCDGVGGLIAPASSTPISLATHSEIVTGSFQSGATLDNVLLYDRKNGQGTFYAPTGSGGLTTLGSPLTGWGTTMTIIPGMFCTSSVQSLLFSDQSTGKGYLYLPSVSASNATVARYGFCVWSKTTKLIPGKFDTGGRAGLLAYDRYVTNL